MPVKDIVVREWDDAQFQLTKKLGYGMLGDVYRADSLEKHPYGQSREPVAVKERRPQLSLDQVRRFEDEYEVLKGIEEQYGVEAPPPVPRAWWGRNKAADARVLILELAPDPFSNHIQSQAENRDRELVALKAMYQYARLLEVLHQVPRSSDDGSGYTCGDRKSEDIRWDPDKERLVVLDWNVVRPKDEDGVLEDIRIFGSLWYQLLTDKRPLDDLSVLNDDFWVSHDDRINVSFALRYVLAKALTANPGRRYQSATELKDEIDKLGRLFQQDAGDLFREGQNALDRGGQDGQIDLEAEREALKKLDLARRREYTGAAEAFEDALSRVKRQGERLIGQARAEGLLNYTTAKERLRSAEGIANHEAELVLKIRRWQLAVRFVEESQYKDRNLLKKCIDDLEEVIAKLEDIRLNWRQGKRFDKIDPRETKQIQQAILGISQRISGGDLLDWFRIEAEIWNELSAAEEDEFSGRYEEGSASLRDASEKLERGKDEPDFAVRNYFSALGAVLPDLEGESSRLDFRARAVGIIAALEDDIISGDADPVSIWYSLWRLEDARHFSAGSAERLKELEHLALDEVEQKLNKLQEFAFLQKDGRWLESVVEICYWLHNYRQANVDEEKLRGLAEYVLPYLQKAKEEAQKKARERRPGSERASSIMVKALKATMQAVRDLRDEQGVA